MRRAEIHKLQTGMTSEKSNAVQEGWEDLCLADLGDVVGGSTPSREVPTYWRGTIPWLTPGEITGNERPLINDSREHISTAALRESGANLLPTGSLLVTTRATLGERVINAVPMATNQGFKSIVFDTPDQAGYFFHLLPLLKSDMVRWASGTTFLEISGADFKALRVQRPPRDERLYIAQILDLLSKSIFETRSLINKLKQVRQGLLHDLLTRGIDSNGQLRGMQCRKSDLPHLLADDETPPGWATGTLEKWLEEPPKNGYSAQEARNWTGKVMLGLGCLTVNGFVPSQIKNAPLDDRAIDAALLNDGDLLMSRSNTRDLVGLAGVYSSVGSPCAYPDLMMRLVPTEETSARFLELVLRSSYVRRQIQAAASGTSGSMAKINSTIVRNLRIAMPDKPEQDTILERVEPMRERLAMEAQRLKALLNIKAGLADDLLTGRVRVTSLLDK